MFGEPCGRGALTVRIRKKARGGIVEKYCDSFEAALTMLSLIEVDRLEGVEPPFELVNESRSVLGNLKVRAVPPVPVPIQ